MKSVPAAKEIACLLERLEGRVHENCRPDVYRFCLSCLDLTSLGSGDTAEKITALTRRAVELPHRFPGFPDVASLCVWPVFVETVGLEAGDSALPITAVAGGFPAAQTFTEVKVKEALMAVEHGADEIDAVMSPGQVLAGRAATAAGDIRELRDAIGPGVVLKVILETGLLEDPALIRNASMKAMEAGADFIKTSTGKTAVAATPEAAVAMCGAIRAFHKATGRRVGFKAAGGVAAPETAARYYTIVEHILGPDWLTPHLFRIGASSLADRLLSAATGQEIVYFNG